MKKIVINTTPMHKRYMFPALIAVASLLLLTGFSCTKKAAETTTENLIRNATNGQANVDLGTNSITINTNSGSYQAGGNVTMPSGFPSDVYVIDGTLTSAITNAATSSYSITIKTTKTVSEVKALYDTQLAAEGWSLPVDIAYQDSASVGGQKDNRTVTVTIANDTQNGGTLVGITTSASTISANLNTNLNVNTSVNTNTSINTNVSANTNTNAGYNYPGY